MRKLIGTALVLTLLAGCSTSQPDNSAADGGPVRREPGLWRTDLKISKIEIPGAPKETVDAMTAMGSELSGVEVCLTPEDAAKEDFGTAFAKAPGNKDECSFTKKDVAGGKLDLVMVCNLAGAKKPTTVAMTGTITPKRVDIRQTTQGEMQGFPLTMELQATNTLVGPCKS